MTTRIKLVGCVNYMYKEKIYNDQDLYDLPDSTAAELLSSVDHAGKPYWIEIPVEKPKPEPKAAEEAEVASVPKKKRKRGRPRKNPGVRTSGASSREEAAPLEKEDSPVVTAEIGVEI